MDMLLIDSRIVPNIYLKVIETKRLIALGIAKNATEAVKMTGISRSAFYKYKDYVSQYNSALGKIVTFQGVLSDTPGGQVSLGCAAIVSIMAGQHIVFFLVLLNDHDLLDDEARCAVHVVRALQIIGHIVFHYATS